MIPEGAYLDGFFTIQLKTEYSHVKAPAISARAPVPVTTSAPLEF